MNYQFMELTTNNHQLVQQAIAIEQAAFGEGGMNHWFLVPFIRHGQVYVLLKDGNVVAVVEYMRDFNDINSAYLFGLAVAENYRNQGLGYQILLKAHERLKLLGIKEVTLTVDPQNIVGLRLYYKLGFKQVQFYENEYGHGNDRLLLSLEL